MPFWKLMAVLLVLTACDNKTKTDQVNEEKIEPEVSGLVTSTKPISEDPDRDVWQKPEKILAKMGDLSGKTVVDIGAGTGYFTFHLANSAERIIATDIEPSFLDYINQRKQEYYPHLENKIITRLTEPNDPFIQANEADWVLLVNTYHYLPDKIKYLSKVKKGLKKNGKLMLIDFKEQPSGKLKTDYPVVSIGEISNNLSASGFTRITVDDTTLPYQYIVIAFF